MKSFKNLFLIITFMTSPIFDFSLMAQTKVVKKADVKAAVVKIFGDNDETGTGFVFFVNDDVAYIMTASHVVKKPKKKGEVEEEVKVGEDSIRIKFDFTLKKYYAKVEHNFQEEDIPLDMAVLSMVNYPKEMKILILGDPTDYKQGDDVYIGGYPGGNEYEPRNGYIESKSGLKIELGGMRPEGGYSGSPLLSKEDHKVIGLIVQRSTNPSDQDAIKIDFLKIQLQGKSAFANLMASEEPDIPKEPESETAKFSTPVLEEKSFDRIRSGPTFGITESALSVDPELPIALNSKAAIGIGWVVEYYINDHLGFRTGLLYLEKGAIDDYEEADSLKEEFTYGFLSIPLMAKFNLGSGAFKPYVLAGFELGINLSATNIYTRIDSIGQYSGEDDLADSTSSTELAINIGGGNTIQMGGLSVFGELVYSIGLTDINLEGDLFAIKTRVFQLSVGVLF